MTFWVAGAVIGSSLIGANAAKGAASTQSDAANRAADLQNLQFQQTRDDQAPYRAAGVNALNQMQKTAGNVPGAFSYDNKNMPGAFKFGMSDFNADPGYSFRFNEGMKALDRQAAARGGLISGGALKAATRYGQDMSSQEYKNAYDRALTSYNSDVNRENQAYGRALTGYNTGVASENQLYNRQAAMAGIGQTATNFTDTAGAANATNVGNSLTSGAAANAAGQVGAANALTGGLSTYLNYNQGNNLMNALNTNRNSAYGRSSLLSEPYSGYYKEIGLS
jgi:hypothetical protein